MKTIKQLEKEIEELEERKHFHHKEIVEVKLQTLKEVLKLIDEFDFRAYPDYKLKEELKQKIQG